MRKRPDRLPKKAHKKVPRPFKPKQEVESKPGLTRKQSLELLVKSRERKAEDRQRFVDVASIWFEKKVGALRSKGRRARLRNMGMKLSDLYKV